MTRWLSCVGLVPLSLAGCGPGDFDYDGFADADDCDPENPLVYPGAPDDPADGVDSDCDGIDPDPPFVGEWRVVAFSAMYSTFDAFAPGSTEGTLTIEADGATVLDATGDLDESLVGFSLPVVLTFGGTASPAGGRGGVTLYLAGEVDASFQVESSELELGCSVLDEVMDCAGTVKALDASLLTTATFEPL
jgi:hypothetical protein